MKRHIRVQQATCGLYGKKSQIAETETLESSENSVHASITCADAVLFFSHNLLWWVLTVDSLLDMHLNSNNEGFNVYTT